MEYIQGISLIDYWNENSSSPFAIQIALQIFEEILDTLLLLKQRGIYHRDIKAENILIDLTKNKATFIDFGFATFSQDKMSTYIGHTPWYSSPQVEAKVHKLHEPYKLEPADVYSLG